MDFRSSLQVASSHRTLGNSAATAAALLAVTFGVAYGGGMPEVPPDLEEVRANVEKYKDPIVAVRDGYQSTIACVSSAKGAMGVHLVNGQLVGQEPDPMRPSVLVYEPVDGKLELVGVEWLSPAESESEKPNLFGQDFHGPMEGHEPLMPKDFAHFDLHVWLFKENPNGTFASWNPNVTCDGEPEYTIVME